MLAVSLNVQCLIKLHHYDAELEVTQLPSLRQDSRGSYDPNILSLLALSINLFVQRPPILPPWPIVVHVLSSSPEIVLPTCFFTIAVLSFGSR
jgi:hypothetical protein